MDSLDEGHIRTVAKDDTARRQTRRENRPKIVVTSPKGVRRQGGQWSQFDFEWTALGLRMIYFVFVDNQLSLTDYMEHIPFSLGASSSAGGEIQLLCNWKVLYFATCPCPEPVESNRHLPHPSNSLHSQTLGGMFVKAPAFWM
jgi:hypothetical protein